MATPTKLGNALAGSPAKAAAAVGRFQAALAGERPYEPVTIPVNGVLIKAVMTVIGSERSLSLEGAAAESTRARGFEQNTLNQGKFELELAWTVLSEAVLDTPDNPVPIGTAEDWGKLNHEVIGDLWRKYAELRARQDPAIAELAKEDIDAITDAVVKKNGAHLRYFGASALARWLLIMGDRLVSSSTESSSPGPSSPSG